MYKSILTPLDGSAFGEHALPLALSIARRAGAVLRLLHVQEPLAAVYGETPLFLEDTTLEMTVRARQRARGLAYLNDVARRLPALSARGAGRLVAEGDVADVIAEQAKRVAADLVVMTTHGRGPLGRFWLGSVADSLVRALSTPLLLVRPVEGPLDLASEPDLSRILLPLDGSDLAEQILEPAVALAALTPGCEITLLRVVKPALREEYMPDGTAARRETRSLLAQGDAIQHKGIEEARGYLADVAERLRARGLRVQTVVTVGEQPAVAILQEAAGRSVGLIALQTHGRRGLSRLILGSIADKIIRGSPVPVLVHHFLGLRPNGIESCAQKEASDERP